VGGVSEWRKVAALAEVHNVGLAPHSFYFGPGLLATAHLIAATPGAGELEHLYGRLEADLWLESPRLEGGFFHLPKGPGLGLEIDRNVLREYRLSPW
jgi:L-alanine-DL-glutamate epimerase-like enolase superfamily enzyme